MKKIAILANGLRPLHPRALAILRAADILVCADGAYSKALDLNRVPDWVVGDGDSLSAREKEDLGPRFKGVFEQETNDLHKCFRFVCETYQGEIAALDILGATGLREDHTLGNIFRLFEFAKQFPAVRLVTDAGFFSVVQEGEMPLCLEVPIGVAVSVFPRTPQTALTSTGLAWPLEGVTFENMWQGTLNRTTLPSFSIDAQVAAALVFVAY